jgi:hypothetical protein
MLLFAGCTARNDIPVCSSNAACAERDGERVTVEGVYRQFPPQTGADSPDIPRGARLELADGMGPYLDLFWSKKAARSKDEVVRYLGKRVRVTGVYRKTMPRNPSDPPMASAIGDPCIEVDRIEP